MQLVNLTPHPITIVMPDATVFTIKPDGTLARVAAIKTPLPPANGIPVNATSYGVVVGLPRPNDGVGYIVSALVRLAVPHRTDIYSPGELVRDASNQVVGCRSLEANAPSRQ